MATSAYLISRAALVTAFADVAVAVTAVRAFAIGRAVLRYAERTLTHQATLRILAGLRVWFFAAVEPLAPAGLRAHRSGDLLARIGADVETLDGFFVRGVAPPLTAALVAVLAALLLGRFDPALGLTALAFLVLAGVVLPLVTRRLARAPARRLIATRATLHAGLADDLQGLAELLAFGQEDGLRARVGALSAGLGRSERQLARVRGAGTSLGALLAALAGVAVLWLAIPLVGAGRIEGVFLALLPLTAIASLRGHPAPGRRDAAAGGELRRRRAPVRDHRRPARGARSAAAAGAAHGVRSGDAPGALQVRPRRAPRAGRPRLRRAAGWAPGHRGAQRGRQEHRGQPPAALLGAGGGGDPHRRAGHQRLPRRGRPPAAGRGAPAALPV